MSRPRATPFTASRRAWLLLLTAVVALMGARVPAVTAMIRERVDAAIASGELQDTQQRPLAVTVGVTVALALSVGVALVVVSLARRLEGRVRLPAPHLAGRSVPGLLLVVGAGLVSKQVASILAGPGSGALDPLVWGLVGACVTAAVTLVARSSDRGGPRRRAVLVGLAVGLAAVAV